VNLIQCHLRLPSQIAISDLSEEARQFRAVAPLLMWSLSSPQQPLETEAFSNRLIAADYSGCWLKMQSGKRIVKARKRLAARHWVIPAVAAVSCDKQKTGQVVNQAGLGKTH